MVTMTTGFHARNHFSNQLTMFMKHGARGLNPQDQLAGLAGVAYVLKKQSPEAIAKDLDVTQGQLMRLLNRKYGGKTVKEHAEWAAEHGLISESVHGFDAKTALDKFGPQKAKGRANIFKPQFVGREASYKIGGYIENTPKFTSYMLDFDDMAREALDAAGVEAAQNYAMKESKKWFIDYEDLTDFEKGTMKNVVPFYTWLRRNLSNQLSGIALYPDTFSIFPKLEDALTLDDPDFDADIIPEWMKQMNMFPTFKTEEGTYNMFNPNFPYQDLNKIPLLWEEGNWRPRLSGKELKDDLINATHPMIKTVMQMMTEKGYDFFYKKDLEDTRKAPYTMRLMLSNPRVLGMVDGVLRSAGYEPDIHVDDNGKLRIDGKLSKILEDNLPILRTLDYLLYGAQTVIPGLEEALEAATGAQDEYEGMEQFFQVLSYYGGIKFKQLDMEKEKERIDREIYYDAGALKREEDKMTSAGKARSMKSKNSTTQKIRRLVGG